MMSARVMICREDDSQELDWPVLRIDRIILGVEGAQIEPPYEKLPLFHSLYFAF